MPKQLLADLIAMRTLSDEVAVNEAALDHIETYLAQRGMSCKRFLFDGHGALVASTNGHRKHTKVMLYAHLDVLDGPLEAFKLRTKGGKLYGRGVFDMKFALAAYMQLVNDLQDRLEEYNFSILITTDEEYGGIDGINGVPHLIREGYRAAVCIMPDGGDDWKVERLAKGVWRFNLEAPGKNSHGARPWEGESASFKLIGALHELKEHFLGQGPETDTVNIGIIKGGVAFNQTPDHMAAAVEVRLAQQDSYNKQCAFIQALCQKYGLIYKNRVLSQPTIHNLSLPVIKEFQASVQAVTGTPPGDCISYGQNDAMYFAEAGIPCVVTRPPGGGAHGDEWLSEKAFLQLPAVIGHFLDKTAKEKHPATHALVLQKAQHHQI